MQKNLVCSWQTIQTKFRYLHQRILVISILICVTSINVYIIIVIETELVDVNNTEDFEFLVNDNSATIAANYIQQQSAITGN